MGKQLSLSGLSDELAQVRTKKKEFLAQIEQIIPWGEWETIFQPYYYKGERGSPMDWTSCSICISCKIYMTYRMNRPLPK